jgi:hypothetical protein
MCSVWFDGGWGGGVLLALGGRLFRLLILLLFYLFSLLRGRYFALDDMVVSF